MFKTRKYKSRAQFARRRGFCLNKKVGLVKVGTTKIRHGQSKIEKVWLDKLNVPERSKVVYGFHGKIMILDGYDAKTNTAFEMNGLRFHGSHKVFPNNRDVKDPWLGKTPNELYYGTLERYNFLVSIGMKVFFVWEDEYKSGKTLGRFYRGPGDNLY